jgi:HEPN domain-containing protein
MNKRVKYWVDLSDYDYDTALAMLKSKRYLYVGFMCHQTIEKIFKAYYSKEKANPVPYSHSLSYLAKKGGFYELFDEEQRDFIDQVEPLNIEARYPSHKEKLLLSLTKARCTGLLENTKSLQEWIKKKL